MELEVVGTPKEEGGDEEGYGHGGSMMIGVKAIGVKGYTMQGREQRWCETASTGCFLRIWGHGFVASSREEGGGPLIKG